ncbi:MAG TPA: hypothetical protein VLH75_00525 [Longimicrobiales bacterium]|nr:hypothetical protein [Longimicrobiales bacterium]
MAALPILSLSLGCDAVLGPTAGDNNWRSYDSAHFSLFVRPGSFAEANRARLAEVLDDQYATTLDRLGITYAGRISAFLYTSAADAALECQRCGMGYPATEALRATCMAPLDGNLFYLLSHEANHVIQWNAMGRPGTYFMSEGLASAVMSTRFHEVGNEFNWAWTASHASAIPPLSVLIDDSKWSGSDVAYKASASFVAYLIDLAGPEPIRQLYPVKSPDFAQRVNTLYGRSLEDLERDWRAFCAARPGR